MKTLIKAIFFTGMFHAFGQVLFISNGASVTVASNTTLSSGDNLINYGILSNDGNLVMSSGWLNFGTYNPGTGLITFNGMGEQIINHNAQSFSRLVIDGGGVKKYLADIVIENELQLTNGLLVAENNSRIIINPGASVINASNASHISGKVRVLNRTGPFIIPVGNGLRLLPVRINGNTINATIEVVDFGGPQSFAFSGQELSAIVQNRYWRVQVDNGSLGPGQIGLRLSGDENLPVVPDSRLAVVQSPASNIFFRPLGSSNLSEEGFIMNMNEFTEDIITLGILSEGIVVYNAISANDDGRNEVLFIWNIEAYPNNRVSIFNRWGDLVFETRGYHNDTNAFRGFANVSGNDRLPTGTYFYVIDRGDGSPRVTGYLSLKN